MTLVRALVGAGLVGQLVAASAVAQPVQIDVNPTMPLGRAAFGRVSSVGWYYTPSSTFFLTMIRTQFNKNVGRNLDRTVSLELWSDRPSESGASLLRSGSFQSNSALNGLGGAGWAPILVHAGVQYFIGFRNVSGLGWNYGLDRRAVSLGPMYYSFGPTFTDDKYERRADAWRPRLQIIGFTQPPSTPVPEPVTMTLMAVGLVGMGGATYLRRRSGR